MQANADPPVHSPVPIGIQQKQKALYYSTQASVLETRDRSIIPVTSNYSL